MAGGRRKKHDDAPPVRPRDILQAEARKIGCLLGSIGDYERLAGIDTQSEDQRRKLWLQFQGLMTGPTQALFDAVVDHCADLALTAVREGRVCLLGNPQWATGPTMNCRES